MNNRGQSLPGAIFGTGFVGAIILAIVFIIFIFGGGAKTIFNISKFITSIPTLIWVIFGVIILFKLLFGGKK